MKAAVINKFGKPDIFEIIDIPVPNVMPDEILIEVGSASVNPVDWKQRKGNHRFIFGSPFPIVLGYDVAGKVIKAGKEVTEFAAGDHVCGVLSNKYGGGLSQYAKGNKKCFAKVPEGIDLVESAALPLAGLTAIQALRDKGKIEKGNKVLIIGAAGGVGHYAVQIANLYGAETTVLSSKRHLEFLKQIGFSSFIDYNESDIFKAIDRYDIIFDTIGTYSFIKCKHLLREKGIYINTLPRPKILIHKILSVFARGKKVKTLLMKHSPADLQLLLSWIKTGKLKVCIDKEFTIRQIAEAHKYSELGHTEGKILIRYNW